MRSETGIYTAKKAVWKRSRDVVELTPGLDDLVQQDMELRTSRE